MVLLLTVYCTLTMSYLLLPLQTIGVDNNRVVISDRLYNVEQIAIASMGNNSIVDDTQKVIFIPQCMIAYYSLVTLLIHQFLIYCIYNSLIKY